MSSAASLLSAFDLLEKEFDRAYVDLDLLLGDPDLDDVDDVLQSAKEKMSSLSSCFSQLCHKSQSAAQRNVKLEAELIHYRTELLDCRAEAEALKAESSTLLRQIHALQLQLHSTTTSDPLDATKIKENFEQELIKFKKDAKDQAILGETVKLLEAQNNKLKERLSLSEKELFGARLAAKYLDKELAGRIQQIQLLGRNIQTNNFEKMWSQLEAEIHLHRHKTVIKACRGNGNLPSPPQHISNDVPQNQGVGHVRKVTIEKRPEEGLGISITGGRDHGVPILISEIHPGGIVERVGGLYVGDALLSVNDASLRDVKHSEAVQLLCQEINSMTLEAVYVTPEDDYFSNGSEAASVSSSGVDEEQDKIYKETSSQRDTEK